MQYCCCCIKSENIQQMKISDCQTEKHDVEINATFCLWKKFWNTPEGVKLSSSLLYTKQDIRAEWKVDDFRNKNKGKLVNDIHA